MAQGFKNKFSHKNVKVHFVGAWYVNFFFIPLLDPFRLIPYSYKGHHRVLALHLNQENGHLEVDKRNRKVNLFLQSEFIK
jgi:hypothetical protein